jgi:uncharacterized protein (TIGR03437 family)
MLTKKILLAGSFCSIFAFGDTLPFALMNGASYQQNAGISPGAIITVKGPNLTNVTLTAPDPTHPPLTLGGVTLSINDIPCALYYVSQTQVNAIIDPSVMAGNAFAVLTSPTRNAQTGTVVQSPSAPAIFTLNGSGSSDGAFLNTATYLTGPFSVVTGSAPTYLALYVTALDLTTAPTVWVGGQSAPVLYYGDPHQYPGMQQINVQLPASLAGAGRVEVVVEQNGRRSNAAEALVLPQQGVFADDQANQFRSRELAAVAWIPGTSTALVADENDDVVRVIDLAQRRVTHVIALAEGAQPVAIGVHGGGTMALVAERGRGTVGLIDLASFKVTGEFQTGLAPSAIVVAADQAVIANSDSDTVSFFAFRAQFGQPALQVTATVPVGRLPRAIAVDSSYAYVTNESAGTISVVNLTTQSVVNTFNLGVNVRPGAIQVLQDIGVVIAAEPSAGPGGKLIFLTTSNGQFTSLPANPDQTGGASSMVSAGDRLYLANQSGGTISTTTVGLLPAVQFGPQSIQINPSNFKAGQGPRSLSIDSRDNWLLTANEGAGTIAATDLSTNAAVATIDALRSSPGDASDDHSDRLSAPNVPTIASVTPSSSIASGGIVTVNVTVNGTNLANATALLLIDPATVPGLGRAKGNANRGVTGTTDPALAVSNLQVSADGTRLTAQIQIQSNTQPRTRVLRVLTPNGETSLTGAPTFSVVPQ